MKWIGWKFSQRLSGSSSIKFFEKDIDPDEVYRSTCNCRTHAAGWHLCVKRWMWKSQRLDIFIWSFCFKLLFLFDVLWYPRSDLNRHAHNERGILSPWPPFPITFQRAQTQETSQYLLYLGVLRCVGMRWLCHLFVTQLHPPGGYRIDPIAVVTCQIH